MQQQNEETIEKLINKREKDRKTKIILIIIIIILLLLFWLLGYKMGKIGYQTEDVTATPDNGMSIIKVMQGDIQITKDTQLDIFNNDKYDGEKIIAPRSSGEYQFCISNETENNIKYHIKFLDEMQYFINMRYKLKIDNIYIRGNEDSYVKIDELNVDNITVLKNSNNIFTLEWYWEDNDELDTLVGMQEERQYYKLKLKINADILDIRK